MREDNMTREDKEWRKDDIGDDDHDDERVG